MKVPEPTVRVYLDHASASPLRPAAREAMLRWLDSADPGRVHTEGRMARAALEDARENVAALLGTRPRQVVFTSGASEAINAAVFGVAARAGRAATLAVVPRVEHSAVREASRAYAGRLRWIGVDRSGRIDLDELQETLAEVAAGGGTRSVSAGGEVHEGEAIETVLVHCQWANHEVGTIQPVVEVIQACRQAGAMVHVDAAAAAGHVPIDFDTLGADFLSVSSAKMGGPRGIGALLVRRGLRVEPLITGGMQERARRAGLENVAAAAGFGAVAAELASGDTLAQEACEASRLIGYLRQAALRIPGVEAFGPEVADQRLPHLLCLGLADVEAEPVLIALDQAGIAAHSGSSCSSEALEPSPVLQAMGVDADRSLRFSVGWSSTDQDVEQAASALAERLAQLRYLRSTAGEVAP